MTQQEDRRAENEAIFRAANENLRAMAEREGASNYRFICECNRVDCFELFSLSLDDYARARVKPTRFVLVDGHENDPDEHVVERNAGLVFVEKTGSGAAVAKQTA